MSITLKLVPLSRVLSTIMFFDFFFENPFCNHITFVFR